MDLSQHSLEMLFAQLGLDASQGAIDAFIASHRPIPDRVALHAADFWSTSQAAFLQQAVSEDADWAEVVDQLDAMLRD